MNIGRAEWLLYNHMETINELVELNEEEENIALYGAPRVDNSGGGHSGSPCGLENQIIRKEKELIRIHKRQNILIARINETESLLSRARGDKYYDIIRMLYFYDYTIEQAARKLKRSVRTVKTHKKRLLHEMCGKAAGERKAV